MAIREAKKKENEHYYARQPRSEPRLGLIRAHLRKRFFEFLSSSSVFSKRRVDLGTRLLIESMVLPEQGYVLDLGCGYGALGITAATSNPSLHVVMVDINERAVWLAKENVKRNKARNAQVRHGFLYEPVKDIQFDAILCNPPISAGMQLVLSIVAGAHEHLKKSGSFQLVVRSKKGGMRLLKELKETFGNVEILAKESGYWVLLSKKS